MKRRAAGHSRSIRAVVEDLGRQTILRAEIVDGQCNKLLAHDFISEPPKLLAETIRAICSGVSNISEQIVSEIDWRKPRRIERAVLRLRICDKAIKRVSAYLRFVDGALPNRLPWSAAPAFEKLAGELLPHAQVMLRAKWNYNYATHLEDIRAEFAKATAALFSRGAQTRRRKNKFEQQPFHVLAFPALEQRNITLHSLLGHEIGHLFARQVLTPDRVADFAETISTELATIVPRAGRREAVATTHQDALSYAEFWRRGLEELLSDTVAAAIFGPAALFSSLEWAFSEGLDIQPDDTKYPPWRYRLRHMLGVLETLPNSTLPVPAMVYRRLKQPRRLYARTQNTLGFIRTESSRRVPPIGANIVVQKIYAHIADDLPKLDRQLLSLAELRSHTVRRSSLYKRIDGLVERLASGITPNEFPDGNSASLVEILNAAWLCKIGAAPLPFEKPDDQDLLAAQNRINNLTLKAIELADIAESFSQWSRQTH